MTMRNPIAQIPNNVSGRVTIDVSEISVDADAGARNGRITAQRQSRTGCLRRFRQQRDLPPGKDRLQQRNGGGRGKRRRENRRAAARQAADTATGRSTGRVRR